MVQFWCIEMEKGDIMGRPPLYITIPQGRFVYPRTEENESETFHFLIIPCELPGLQTGGYINMFNLLNAV